MENKRIDLDKGDVLAYDFENIRIHSYNNVDYIESLIVLANNSSSIDEMIERVKDKYPSSSEINYLEMTAGLLFFKNNIYHILINPFLKVG